MINQWMTVKVKFTRQQDNGVLKRVTEQYLVAGLTFGSTEERIYTELEQIIRGEFNVTGITRTVVHDIFAYGDTGVWYDVKVKYESMDTDTEKSKKVTQKFLVEADSVEQATERCRESLSTLMVDFEITGTTVSPIVEIFPYAEELDKELSRTAVLEEA